MNLPPATTVIGDEESEVEIPADSPLMVTYQLSNPGQLALNPREFKPQGGTVPYLMEGDLNGNNLLDSGETWEYMTMATTLPGQQESKMEVQAIATNDTGTALGLPNLKTIDSLYYTGVQVAPTGDLSQLFGKIEALTFQYVATNTVLTGGKDNNQDGKAKIESGAPDDDDTAYIVVSQSNNVDDIKKGDKPLYFAGTVEVGQSFTASLDFANEDKFENDTRILVFEDEAAFIAGAEPLQVSKYKTDGSQPMTIGDLIGPVQLLEYQGTNGGYNDPELDPLTGQIGSGFSVIGLFGSAQELTFRYDASTDLLTGGKGSNQDGKAKILGNRIIDDDGTSFIRISDKSKPDDLGGKEYFEGLVNFGQEFTASVFAPTADTDKFGGDTYIHYFDDQGGQHLGSVQYKTDGSQPMQLGDQLSGLTLIGYNGVDGSAFLV
jgi:hypothetical protein